jgi:hypothetical protein
MRTKVKTAAFDDMRTFLSRAWLRGKYPPLTFHTEVRDRSTDIGEAAMRQKATDKVSGCCKD